MDVYGPTRSMTVSRGEDRELESEIEWERMCRTCHAAQAKPPGIDSREGGGELEKRFRRSWLCPPSGSRHFLSPLRSDKRSESIGRSFTLGGIEFDVGAVARSFTLKSNK